MLKVKDFFLKYNGVGLDFDGVYGDQCVDVFKQFNKDVVVAPNVSGNAIDYWTTYPTDFYDKVENTLANAPQEGDVLIWGKGIGQFGHIAVCFVADTNHFISFDQNYPTGSVCHFQNHNYTNLLGWLRPKNLPQNVLTITDQTVIPQLGLEVQAIRSKIHDQENTIYDQETKINDLNKKLADCQSVVSTGSGMVTVTTTTAEPSFKNPLARFFYGLAKNLG